MKFTIYKGRHRAWPPVFGFLFHQWMERDVVFDESAAYDLGSDDNNDVNKLFGFGYFKGGHHQDSARFGWNYNQDNGRVRIFAYCHVSGERIIKEICQVLPHKKVRLLISIYINNRYVFSAHDGYNNWHQLGAVDIPFTHEKKFKYRLGCFFGGNNPAPQNIRIKISRK